MKMNPPARSSRPISRKKPRIMHHLKYLSSPKAVSQYRGRPGNSTSSAPYAPVSAPFPAFREGRKALTVPDSPSIRPPMAACAIPPPLFFEQRRSREHFGFRPWHPQERLTSEHPGKHHQRSRNLNGRRARARPPDR